MAYFLKKTNNKKGTYLQIYSSFYDPERRHTAHKAYKPIGYVHELQAKGIDDPISFYKEEVIRLNQEANAAKAEPAWDRSLAGSFYLSTGVCWPHLYGCAGGAARYGCRP